MSSSVMLFSKIFQDLFQDWVQTHSGHVAFIMELLDNGSH